MKTEFNVPADLIIEFAEKLTDHELNNEIIGTTDEDEVNIEVEFTKSQFDIVQELADLLLGALKLDRFFSVVYGAGRMSYVKPDARIFHDVMRDLNAATGIMIGDSVTDVATARAARAPVILVSYGYTPEPADTLGGDAVTDDFRQIPNLARQIKGAGR